MMYPNHQGKYDAYGIVASTLGEGIAEDPTA